MIVMFYCYILRFSIIEKCIRTRIFVSLKLNYATEYRVECAMIADVVIAGEKEQK